MRDTTSLLALILLGFLVASYAQAGVKLQRLRTSFGIPMEDVREAIFLLIEDPTPLRNGSWVADAHLIKTASNNLITEANGQIVVFGQSHEDESGLGRIIHASGHFTLTDDKSILWHCDSLTQGEWIIQPLAWRNRMLRFMSNRLEMTSRDTFTFLSVLILGQKIDTGSRIIRYFREAGCMHLLALSGFHVGLVAIAVRRLMKPMLGLRGASIASLILVVFYLLLVGFRPSLVRAVLMYGLWVRDQYKGYKSSPLNYLCIAFILQILLFPHSVTSLSFVLSYTALVGILVGGLNLASILGRYLPKQIAGIIGIGFGAQSATMPIVVKTFGLWRPVAMISAVVLTPFVALSMAVGTIMMCIPSGRISDIIALSLDYLVGVMTKIAGIFSHVPSLHMNSFLPWLFMAAGFILPTIYRNHVYAVEPQLPHLNPSVSEIAGNSSAEALGTKFPD